LNNGGGETDCGNFKVADQFPPVDPEVQAAFKGLYHRQVNPTLVTPHRQRAAESNPDMGD